MLCGLFPGPCTAQEITPFTTQTIAMDVVPETGCPVEITGGRTELGFDSFGLPVFGKTYIDYKNVSDKAINAVKFRVRYLDKSGASRGTFHANDEAFVPQGGLAGGKFAHYKLRSNIHQAKIRVLAVKFSDGSMWESVRMKDIQKAQQEGKEIDADDDAADKAAPVKTQEKPPASEPVQESKPVEPTSATPAPQAEPLTATPSTIAPAEAVPASQTPASATQAQEPVSSQPVATPAVSTPPSAESKSAPVEEEPLSATPKSLPLNKKADPFSQ